MGDHDSTRDDQAARNDDAGTDGVEHGASQDEEARLEQEARDRRLGELVKCAMFDYPCAASLDKAGLGLPFGLSVGTMITVIRAIDNADRFWHRRLFRTIILVILLAFIILTLVLAFIKILIGEEGHRQCGCMAEIFYIVAYIASVLHLIAGALNYYEPDVSEMTGGATPA